MAGAYTAKAAAAAADPGYPPGWPSYPWPFPSGGSFAYPPGYTPTLSLLMTATDSIAFDGTASVTGSARDQDTYVTNEPSAITWRAQDQDENVVNLRFSGEEDYSSSISSDVSFGSYWGATPSIEFELTADNVDDVITLTGFYTLDEIQVVSTESITIATQIVITAHYELIGSIGAGYYYGRTSTRIQGTSLAIWQGAEAWYWPDEGGWYDLDERPEDEVEVVTDAGSEAGGTVTTTVSSLRAGEIYEVEADVNFTDCSARVTLTITIGDDEYEYIDNEDGFANKIVVEIDADTLVVTQTNP